MSARKRTADLENHLRASIEALGALLGPSEIRGRGTLLADLLFRVEQSSQRDGYPAGSAPERVNGGGVGNPTLSTVEARESDVCGRCDHGMILKDGILRSCSQCNGSGRRWADPVADAVGELVENLWVAVNACRTIEKKRRAVLDAGREARGRQSSLQGACLACGTMTSGVGEDRLRRGVCGKCYQAWVAWRATHKNTDDPGADFQRFLVDRRVWLAEKVEGEAIAKLREMNKPMGRVG